MVYSIPYEIGMDKMELDTPVLLLDLDVMEKNISEMAKYFHFVKADLRPHIKNHMSPIIAHKQIDAGAIGICCQTIGEAEVMGYSGLKEILICNEVIGDIKIKRLMSLAAHTNVMVTVDDPQNIENLSKAALKSGRELGVLIDINTGYNRCGLVPGDSALKLVQQIVKSEGLSFKGINGYTPMYEKDPVKRKEMQEKMLKKNIDMKDLLEKNNIEVDIISAGCTSVYNIAAEYPGITDVQACTYVFMDLDNEEIIGTAPADLGYALTILTTVISKPTEDRLVIDAGNKCIATEKSRPKDVTGIELYQLSAEHGRVRVINPNKEINVGDKMEFIPSYCDGTVNRWNKYYGIRKGNLELVWDIHHYHQ